MLKYFFILTSLFVLITLNSCSTQNSFDGYTSTHVKFAKRKIESTKMGYTICVPYLWDLKRNYEGQFLIETFIDSRKLVFDSPSLSIAKFKGNSNDLDLYVDFLSKEELLPEEFSVVSRGESDFLNYDSYYTHVRSVTDAINEIEVITFILKGKEDSTFFTIMSSAPQDKDLNTNMAMLMNCSRQFELK